MNLKEEIQKHTFTESVEYPAKSGCFTEVELINPDDAIRIAEQYGNERAGRFAEWCNQKGWLFRKGIGNWNCFHEDKVATTEELYIEFEQTKKEG